MKRLRERQPNLILCLILGLLGVLSACAAPAIQPLRFGDAPWQSGETTTYRLVDSDSNPLGSAIISLSQEEVGGVSGWMLRREVTGAGGAEVSNVAFAAAGYRPIQSAIVRSGADGAERVNATYDQGEVNLELTTRQNNITYKQINVPTDARDQRSIWTLTRTLPLAQGYSANINSFLPLTGRLERLTVTVGRQEQVTVPAGRFDAWPIVIDNGERETRLWLDINAPHTLVKVEDGEIVWELANVETITP